MFKANYDTDVTVWSPQGRMFQVEYAMEAVKQGATVVGLRSDSTVVLCSLRRRHSALESYQQKIYKIDDHLAAGIAGITADARVIHKFLRNECLNHHYVYGTSMNVGRLATTLAHKAQKRTQTADKRPYGVGMLLAGFDQTGPHLYETCPSGNLNEYLAMAIGGRAQSAKTYLENNYATFAQASVDELISHGVQALTRCLEQDAEINKDNISICMVGKDLPFRLLTEEQLAQVIPTSTPMETN
jgi:20S proteasome subunit alpha 6